MEVLVKLLVEGNNGSDEDGHAESDGKNAMYSEDSASIVAHLLYTLNP